MYKNYICILTVALLLFSCRGGKNSTAPADKNTSSSETVICYTEDSLYNSAFNEILAMLEDREPLSVKRAAFLIEWAYLRGELDYGQFCDRIASTAEKLNRFIDQSGVRQYRTSGNYALFEYFTKPNWMNGNKPFTYDFEDFSGHDDYTKLFVSNVMEAHTGQCRSLPIYYMILADEIVAESFLAQAPNHLYIKHRGEDGRWVNLELTNGTFVADEFFTSTTEISRDAIRNKVYLDAMSEKETITFLLAELTHGYEKLYGYDDFVLLCCDKSLEYYPQNIPALMMKYNAVAAIGAEYHRRLIETQVRIDELGYRDMTEEQYLEWVQSMEAEKQRLQVM